VTDAFDLERGYRRWLRWYPKTFRRDHEDEILAVLLACARQGQRRPEPMECIDLMRSALWMRLRLRVPRSDRSAPTAVRLMYVGAVVELATALVVVATMGDVKSAVVARNPGYTRAQWHAELAGNLDPLVVAAGMAVGLWLWLAWANGRGRRWARIAFAIFFIVNVYGLLAGLVRGSAVYARADLAIGTVLCLVQLAAVALLVHSEFRKVADSRSGSRRIGSG
jgi:hypothetical protein